MSQCAAAHSGLKARDEKRKTAPKVAFLLGSRKVEMLVKAFPAGQILLIQASRIANTTDSAIFSGEIRDSVSGTLLMKAQLMFHEPDVLETVKQP
jgi:predicted hotdog family 3-hydroxylacyl-ACP dehydratase